MSDQKTNNWWSSFYEETPFELFMERRDPAVLEATLDFLVHSLNIAPGDSVFDQCCGFGSLSIPLAKRGYQLTGVDLCHKYIERAKTDSDRLGTRAKFACADAFQFKTAKKNDGAFNWYTSFGYSEDDDVNILMLQRAYESLKAGRRFVLEYPNIAYLLKRFKSRISYSREAPGGKVSVVRQCSIDPNRGLMLQRWTHTLPDGREIASNTSLRLYLPHTLTELFKRAGFVNVQMLGDIDGSPISLKSERCIVVGTRPNP